MSIEQQDRWAIDTCKAFFGLTDHDEQAVSGDVGVGYLLRLWQEQQQEFYEHPLMLLRQEVWHQTIGPVNFPMPEGFWRTLAPNDVLLDYGCGTAELVRSRWINLGRTTILVDISKKARAYLEHKYRPFVQGGSVKIQAPGNPPIDEQSIDALVCTDVMEHVPKPLALLQVLWRLLKPQGQALFVFGTSYPHAGHLKASIDEQPQWFQWLEEHSNIVAEDGYIWAVKTTKRLKTHR